MKVNPDLSVPGYPEAFAIGDMALVRGADGKPVPGVSPAAMQMAKHVARIIERELLPGEESLRPPATPRGKQRGAQEGSDVIPLFNHKKV